MDNFNLNYYLKPIVVPGLGSSRLVPPEDAPPRPMTPLLPAESSCSGPTLGSCLPLPPLPEGGTWRRLDTALASTLLLTTPPPVLMADRDGEGSSLGKLIRSQPTGPRGGSLPPTADPAFCCEEDTLPNASMFNVEGCAGVAGRRRPCPVLLVTTYDDDWDRSPVLAEEREERDGRRRRPLATVGLEARPPRVGYS